jgi:hypothetical protein
MHMAHCFFVFSCLKNCSNLDLRRTRSSFQSKTVLPPNLRVDSGFKGVRLEIAGDCSETSRTTYWRLADLKYFSSDCLIFIVSVSDEQVCYLTYADVC